MPEFQDPSNQLNGAIIDEDDWNDDLVNNLFALNERASVGYPHKQVANTTTETDLFSHTIPANALGTKGFIAAELSAVVQNASGATRVPYVRFKLGTTQIFAYGPSIATGSNRSVLNLRFRLQNVSNYAQQLSTLRYEVFASPVPAGSAQGMNDGGQWHNDVFDTSVEQTLNVTAFWDAADVSCIFDLVAAAVTGPVYKT